MACAIVAQALLGLSINCKALQHTQCLLVPRQAPGIYHKAEAFHTLDSCAGHGHLAARVSWANRSRHDVFDMLRLYVAATFRVPAHHYWWRWS